jgi:hypothetical protein
MMGFLIDEDEFEVQPAVTRIFQIYETESKIKKRNLKKKFLIHHKLQPLHIQILT